VPRAARPQVPRDEPISVLSFTVSGGRIAEIDLVANPAKLRRLAIQH
jgi:hypothetical protein